MGFSGLSNSSYICWSNSLMKAQKYAWLNFLIFCFNIFVSPIITKILWELKFNGMSLVHKNEYHRARWLRGKARDSHSGGPWFESRCRPTCLGGFFVLFLSHQSKCWVGFSLPRSIWPLFINFIYIIYIYIYIYHKIKISELNKWIIDYTTIEIHSLQVHTQRP